MKKISINSFLHCRGVKKLLLIMKLTTLLLMSSLMQVSATVYSQATKFSFKTENKQIVEVLKEIEESSNFRFFYIREQVDVERKVSVKANNATIEEILDELFAGKGINYKVMEDNLVLLSQNKNITELQSVSAQQKTVTGKVIDNSGQPLPGVTVLVKGTTQGTVTNADGNYFLSNIPSETTLVFSFVGMNTQEVIVGNQNSINVEMVFNAIGIDEVVAIGYGTSNKSTVTGSISTVKGDKLQASQSTNITNSLSGLLPGLVVVSRSGEPGRDDALLRIRGSNTLGDNSPLIVIDGIANRSLTGLNSADIESITVLKDASAAIYGSQAANGVILVTTKRGMEGKPEVSVSLNQGFSMPTIMPELADAATWAQMVNEIDSYRSRPLTFSQTDIQKYKDGSDPWLYPNSDWFAEVYKPVSLQNNLNFALTGGTDRLKYFFSSGYKFQDGNYRNSATNYSQADFRSNIDAKISDNIKLSIDVLGRQENRNYSPFDADQIFRFCKHSFPTMPAYWPNGLPGPDIEYGWNPVVLGTDQGGYDKAKQYVFESNVKFDITIPWVEGLSVTGNASIDKHFQNRKIWEKPWYLYSWDRTSYDENNQPLLLKSQKGLVDPQLTQMMSESQRITLNTLINYERTIAKNHNIKVLAGMERISGESMNFQAFRKYFVSTEIDQLFAGGDLEKSNTGSGNKSARLNYFGRVNYNYMQKYLVEFVGRYDGSYIFPSTARFGFFPGISLGWRISEEDFWKNNIAFIDYFKLRGSWGQTGNDRIEEYQYLLSYGFGEPYIFDSNLETKTMQELQIANPIVTWEVANQTNVGIDTKFGEHITFSADYFNNLRTNILWWRNASVPATTGLSLPRENIGEVANQGFDFDIGYNNSIKDFSYQISLNGGFQKNKIKFWDETPGVPDYQKSTGHPMNSNLYYQAIGIFKDQAAVDAYPHWDYARPGDIIFEDFNKDGVIDARDMVRSDKTDMPTFTGGMNINLTYSNFYATILFQGAAGVVQYYNGNANSGTRGNFEQKYTEGRWTVDNTDATKPRAWNANDEYWISNENTYWLTNSDYLRLKNIEIGYNMPNTVNKKLGTKALRIYFSGINLFTLDKLDNYDPEANDTWGTYPPQKVYNIGFQLTF